MPKLSQSNILIEGLKNIKLKTDFYLKQVSALKKNALDLNIKIKRVLSY